MANGNGTIQIKKLVAGGIATIITSLFIAWAVWASGGISKNSQTNEVQEKSICDAKEERKENKDEIKKTQKDVQDVILAVRDLIGEMKVTNAKLDNLADKKK